MGRWAGFLGFAGLQKDSPLRHEGQEDSDREINRRLIPLRAGFDPLFLLYCIPKLASSTTKNIISNLLDAA
jgi:hypothetical protein